MYAEVRHFKWIFSFIAERCKIFSVFTANLVLGGRLTGTTGGIKKQTQANPGPIFIPHKCDEESQSLQCVDTKNGL